MTSGTDIIRRRRRLRKAPAGRGWLVAILTMTVVIAGGVMAISAILFADISADLPDVREIEAIFQDGGRRSYQPSRVYDRTGEILLMEIAPVGVEEIRWVTVDSATRASVPLDVLQAILIAQDPGFWTNPGYQGSALAAGFYAAITRAEAGGAQLTITEQLVMAQLLPLRASSVKGADQIRSAILSAELTRAYSKSQILEWYLNSAYFGRFAYGLDAAAQVYFGKHAAELDLGEAALLAALAAHPEFDPEESPEELELAFEAVIEALQNAGTISPLRAKNALTAPPETLPAASQPAGVATDFARSAWERFGQVFGPWALRRGGLKITTSLDIDLQMQAVCAAESQRARLNNGEPGATLATTEGGACLAAGLLPALRPGDTGVDHRVGALATIVLDSASGEVLAMYGDVASARPAGTSIYPWIYLTAFSQGYAPGSMVLDVPTSSDLLAGPEAPGRDWEQYMGPVRIRAALANSYHAAAEATLRLVGPERVTRTANTMGIEVLGGLEAGAWPGAGNPQVDLQDLAQAFAILAVGGRSVGVADPLALDGQLRPAFVLSVHEASGRLAYRYEASTRAVLSPELAYLLVDVLSDEPARWSSFGRPNALEIGQPAAVSVGITEPGSDNWTIGATPSLVVGVWIGNSDDQPMVAIDATNGAASIWHAVIRYALRTRPREGWVVPPGLTRMEVCNPSGLLPTEYCPAVVREIYLQGTEPTAYDSLYQPFLVNKETGKLATLGTPIDVVEERVYLIPPPGALAWADATGVERPPQEYDTFYGAASIDPAVGITSPENFSVLRGQVRVEGTANPDDFTSYRLQYGPGLNPIRWIQVGEDEGQSVTEGLLGLWDTSGLDGLYTLQLVVILADGRIETAWVHVTLDNQAPEITLLEPAEGGSISLKDSAVLVLEAQVEDSLGVREVRFYVDERLVATLDSPPYSVRTELAASGSHTLVVRAVDRAGNVAETEPVEFTILP